MLCQRGGAEVIIKSTSDLSLVEMLHWGKKECQRRIQPYRKLLLQLIVAKSGS